MTLPTFFKRSKRTRLRRAAHITRSVQIIHSCAFIPRRRRRRRRHHHRRPHHRRPGRHHQPFSIAAANAAAVPVAHPLPSPASIRTKLARPPKLPSEDSLWNIAQGSRRA